MMQQPDVLYHFTDTARLPWILDSGFLKPGANRIGGFPDPDFIWASTNPKGDATASMDRGEHFRTGKSRQVRFTLPRALMFPWSEVPARYPSWEPRFVRALEASAAGMSAPSTWWCRLDRLPLSDVAAIHTRSYRDNRWLPFDCGTEVVETMQGAERWLSVVVEGTAFASTRTILGGVYAGAEGYKVGIGPVPAAKAAPEQDDGLDYPHLMRELADSFRSTFKGDDSFRERIKFARQADVATAVWPEPKDPRGFDMLLLRGEGRLEAIVQTGRSSETRVTAIPCDSRAQAEVMRQRLILQGVS